MRLCIFLMVSALAAAAADPYFAFSLQVASLQVPPPTDLGLTRITGIVRSSSGDFIIVGQRGAGASVTLGDLMTALKARLVYGKFPLVSIDRTSQTVRTGLQTVRFEGGVENTGFGAKLLQADIRLKRLALGLDGKSPSYFEWTADSLRRNETLTPGTSLLWFHNSGATLVQREDVFAIRDLRIGVRSQALAKQKDPIADRFAEHLSSQYPNLSAVHPEIAELRTLFSLVAIATAFEEPFTDTLVQWVRRYQSQVSATPKQYELVKRSERIGGHELILEGGIDLTVRRIKLQEGDVTALRDMVLESRPSADALSWPVPLEAWLASEVEIQSELHYEPRPGTEIRRRIEIIPELLIYRGGIAGNQTLSGSRPSVIPKPTNSTRGGVAADVVIDEKDFKRKQKGGKR